jgi:hypothetical protein
VILRCTGKLLALLGIAELAEVPVSDEDWYANLIWLDRRRCLVLMHADTLFPIFVADVLKRDLRQLGQYVVAVVIAALSQEHLPADVLGELDPNCVRLARTASRSTLGFMNEIAHECRYHVEAAGGLDNVDVGLLNGRLRRTLHNRDGYHEPLEFVARRLHAPWAAPVAA